MDLSRLAHHATYVALSAHKLYGPKGAGALIAGQTKRSATFQALIAGGGQESGRRGGTENVPAIVGFGVAARMCTKRWLPDAERVRALRDLLLSTLSSALTGVRVHGCLDRRLPNNISVHLNDVPARALIAALPQIALSTGSACTSASNEPSHVLTAIGTSPDVARATVRLGLGRHTTEAEVLEAVRRIASAARAIRAIAELP